MLNEVKNILESSKKAYRESIVIENKIMEDELLTIIGNAQYLLNQLEGYEEKKQTRSGYSGQRSESEEIERVTRKIRLWSKREHQFNYKILKAYMELSDNDKHSVSLDGLEKQSGINDSQKFFSHYNGMKLITEKNHGKVFDESDGSVVLWAPVAEVVIKEFRI